MGDHLIQIRDQNRKYGDVVSLRVTNRPIGYRHAVGLDYGQEEQNRALAPGLVFGLGTGLLVTAPLALLASEETAGTVMLLSGTGIAIVGWLWYQKRRPVKQQGAGTAWQF